MTGAMMSPSPTPTVMMALSAICAPGELADQRGGLLDGRRRCGWRRRPGLLALELDRVDGDDVAGAGQGRALHGVHADAAGADDDDGLAGLHVGRRRWPSPSRW